MDPRTITLATTIGALLAAPATAGLHLIARQAARLHDDEEGAELVTWILLMGGVALVVVALIGIVNRWATNEAENLPSSGDTNP